MNQLPTEIIPNLWLSNKECAGDIQFIEDKKIDILINCTKNIPFTKTNPSTNRNIQKIRIAVDDNHRGIVSDEVRENDKQSLRNNKSMLKYLMSSSDFIHNSLMTRWGENEGDSGNHGSGCILVYCSTGLNQSVAIVMGYLMKYGKMTKGEAINCIRSKYHFPDDWYSIYDIALTMYEKKL